ncbi:MAG: GGDEF domain-containing protein, partial [Gammaproteobacteria bacterium]|nr:GGDEF domain-containing protein [Gammaproteobacteria bacterium]
MKFQAVLLWQPGALWRTTVMVMATALAFGVVYLHTLTGLAYEFHMFFILPVLLAAWFVGVPAGYGLAVLVVSGWFVADRMLAGGQADPLPLFFNTCMRLAIFVFVAWLMGALRRVLANESRLAREDVLTQLPNRREFLERGRQAFAQAQRQRAPLTVVFIDLDRFKEVNDSRGHDVGDALLVKVASVIRSQVRESDIPGRLGGDEFALLLANMAASAASAYIDRLRQRLLDAMREQGW